ncbi:Moulting cycle family protein [Acanthocheilonema viteae]
MRYHGKQTAILVAVWMACITVGSVSSSIQYTRETMPGAQYYDGKKLNIPISKEAGIQLIERWIHQGISSIMACIATQHLNELNEYERNRLQKCSKSSEDIYEQARCLVRAIDAKPKQTDPTRKFNDTSFPRTVSHLQKLQKLLNGKRKNTVGALIQSESHEIDVKRNKERKQVEFRTRRSVVNRHNYKLHTEYEHLTPFGILGKYLAKMTRVIKNKDPNLSWKKMMHDIESIKRRENEKNDFAEQLQKRFSLNRYGRPKLTPDEKRLAKELHISDHLLQGLDKNNVKTKKTLEIIRLFQRAIKLAMVLNGANGTELENKTLRLGSPRLLSVVPNDAKDQISILSPSLFSMHDKGKGLEALTSIPALLKIAGNRDYDEWLNFIMEASGTTDAVHKLKESQKSDWLPPGYKSMPRGIDGQPMYFTKENLTEIDPEMARKMEVFENLTRSLTSKQLMDFNTTGFSMLTPKQLFMFYGPQSPLNNSKALDFFMSLSEDDMHRHLINDIRDMAKMHSSLKIRQKRQNVLAPSAFTTNIFNPSAQPSILSPAAFSLSLFSPSVFGAAILSPGAFLSTILSPRAFAPAVLSPVAFASLILSPFALNPGILSPAALSPAILSPNALSPGIVSPSVLSPAILSPFALNPSVFSPSALGSVIASPFALSPSFFSPSYIAAVIFSPHAFSPSFNSTGRGVTVLFSPSIGS